MTLALLALAAVLVAFLAYRLAKFPGLTTKSVGAPAVAQSFGAISEAPPVAPTGHMVFSGPIEKNDHGFITTPMVACLNPSCACRTFR